MNCVLKVFSQTAAAQIFRSDALSNSIEVKVKISKLDGKQKIGNWKFGIGDWELADKETNK